jgi:ribonuclease inhibitor
MLKTYKYNVDFSEAKHFIEIHEVLKRDLDFPDYYGGNLDALWDCLTDMLGGINYIEIHGFDVIEKKFPEEIKGIRSVLQETKHAYNDAYSNRFFVTIVHQDGTREEIK